MTAAEARDGKPQPADVLVIFGITGDLARVMTFHSLDQLVERARDSIAAIDKDMDEEVFARFAKRLSYLHGDFTDDATYAQVAKAIADVQTPVFYLEVPPSLFGTVVGGL